MIIMQKRVLVVMMEETIMRQLGILILGIILIALCVKSE